MPRYLKRWVSMAQFPREGRVVLEQLETLLHGQREHPANERQIDAILTEGGQRLSGRVFICVPFHAVTIARASVFRNPGKALRIRPVDRGGGATVGPASSAARPLT